MILPHRFGDIPYLIHTNRELGLMLKGIKPLSAFMAIEGRWPGVLLRYFDFFDRHVEAGRLVRQDYFLKNNALGRSHYVHFALPGEEWRIEAMMELLSHPGKWSRKKERAFGELLGYTPEQNEIWLTRFYKGSD
jgi:hypothetical protein